MANIHFIDRFSGEFYKANQAGTNIASFDVSSRAKYPFHTLSPSTYNSQIKIPVIGLEGEIAHSVEGIWEGLAIIHGSIAKECFQQKPKKRRDEERNILTCFSKKNLLHSLKTLKTQK